MVAAVHSCIAGEYGDWVIRLPTVISQSRSEVQYAADDCSNNLRGSNMDGTIEPPQIRFFQWLGGIFSFIYSKDFLTIYLPQTKLK